MSEKHSIKKYFTEMLVEYGKVLEMEDRAIRFWFRLSPKQIPPGQTPMTPKEVFIMTKMKKYFAEMLAEYGKIVEMNGRTWNF